jgi:hypothetical protein
MMCSCTSFCIVQFLLAVINENKKNFCISLLVCHLSYRTNISALIFDSTSATSQVISCVYPIITTRPLDWHMLNH